ncbi:MAG: conserved rane protein of unknown function [Anaerolineales bacterium]|nr:conserved rane protein of unknown function [Anaerolineales bacterium]
MPRRLYLLLTFAILVGAFLRLWQLTAIPPGLHYDLAATALLGNDVAFDGYRPIFITAYTGHEVLFYYWLASWFRLAGSSVFTLRLAAATLGLLTIPAAYFAIRQVMRFEENARLLAAFAAAFLAFAFFHVTFSRFGFRVIAEPLVQSLALGFLFRGLHRGVERRVTSDGHLAKDSPSPDDAFAFRRQERGPGGEVWDFALAGVFTGLAAYTYLAARLFPFPLAIFWLALLLSALRSPQSAIRTRPPASPSTFHLPPSTPFVIWSFGFLVFSFSALLAFAPLGLYFLRHPEDFLNRASQVTPRPGEAALLLQGIRRAAEMIFVNGEPYDRFNLPGLPLFGPILGSFFVIGLLITLLNLLHPSSFILHPLSFSTELLLLAWLPFMLLPTAVSIHDVFPSNLRAFGLVPLVFVFPARGLLAGYRWLQSRLPGPLIPSPYPLTLVCLVALAAGGYTTYRDYFITWANLPNQRLNDDADLTAIAGYLNAQDLAGAEVFVSAIHYRHPTLAYLAHDYLSIRWFTGGTSLAIPANEAALYLFARSAPPPDEWIAAWSSHLVAAPGPENIPDFRAYRFAAGETPPLPEFTPLDENFGNAITLTGYRIQRQSPISNLSIDLRWRIENTVEITDLIPYARLYDAWGAAWSQSGGFTYPSEQWSPGDTLLTRVAVPVPAGLPPGDYTLKAGMYSEKSQSSLPHLDAQGGYAGDRAALGGVSLPGGPSLALEDFLAQNPMTAPFADPRSGATGTSLLDPNSPLTLLGYTLNTTTPRQGERLQLTLFWHAPHPVSPDPLTILLAGQPLYSGQPVHNTFPFWEWSPGQLLADRYALRLPPDMPPGPAELTVNVKGYGSATLTSLDVSRVDRNFTAPAPATPVEYDFNHEITLRGYGLQPGPSTSLILYWQSLISNLDDYTVFVHVLDASGQIVAQADSQPRGGAYPTSLWVLGEYVSDPYTFTLAPGTYTLDIGLYLPETGDRLPVFDASGNSPGNSLTLPPFQVP